MKRKYHATFWRGGEEVLFEHPIRLDEDVSGGLSAGRGDFFIRSVPDFGLERLEIKLSDNRCGAIVITAIEPSSQGSHFVTFKVEGPLA